MPLFDGRFDAFLTVDGLRAAGAVPKWFGLGFIQIKLNDRQRMHFWHPELSADTPEEELHDHRYFFTSHVVAGETTHEEWFFRKDDHGDHEMVAVNCKPGSAGEEQHLGYGRVEQGGSYTMVAGSKYTFPPTGYHRIRAERCVTFLERGDVLTELATVIRPLGTPAVCPFERQIPEPRLWECVADLLENRLPKPGYHLTEIPKGVLGQSSKILEEVLELIDAEKQGAKVMADVELSDLYGAIRHYLAANRPGTTMRDLEIFADITERAFVNGRRS
jgi:hypothetical protein